MNAESHHMSDLFVTYTLFPDTKPKAKTERADVPWEEFVGRVLNAATYISKSACPLVSFTEYGDELSEAGCIRHAANAKRVYGCEFDYDGEQMSIQQAAALLEEQRIEALLYTSPSHKPEAPRWRVIFPFAEAYAPEKRADFVGRANRILGGVASTESFTLSQSFYIGRVGGVEYEVLQTHGRCLDAAFDIEPLYPVGTATQDGTAERDETPDRALIATIRHEDGAVEGLSRYAAMVKLAARLVCRDLDDDDAVSVMREVLGDNPAAFHSTGGDPHKAVRSMVKSARRKFGDPRRKPIKETAPDPDGGLPLNVDPETGEIRAPGPKRSPIDWESLEGHVPPERLWRIAHWLTTGPTLFAGKGGTGKTLVSQMVATALALGRNFIDEVSGPTTVLFWACEDEMDELWRRQIAICNYFGAPLSALKDRLIIQPRLGLDNALMVQQGGRPIWTPLRDELAAQVKDYGAQVLFMDNIGQVFGANENDRHHVTGFMNGLSALVSSSVLMGHPAKAEGSEFSGSTAWENAVRMRWYLGYKLPDKEDDFGQADESVRYLAKRKANYSQHDYRKLVYSNGVLAPEVVPVTSIADRYHAQRDKEQAQRACLEAVNLLNEKGQHARSAPTSPDYLPKKMAAFELARGFTPKELAKALNQLIMDGKIKEVVVGKTNNRLQRMGLVPA